MRLLQYYSNQLMLVCLNFLGCSETWQRGLVVKKCPDDTI